MSTLSPPTLKMKPVPVITDEELAALLKACASKSRPPQTRCVYEAEHHSPRLGLSTPDLTQTAREAGRVWQRCVLALR